jgi:hypothetical protein
MPGALLNLVATGPENVILNSNPKKTFFNATYAKHTNFGMQKFRLNYEKEKELSFLHETTIKFKIPRYGDLINDTFLCMTLPDIYSPFYYHKDTTRTPQVLFVPYEFQWCKHIGTTIIKEIEIYAGGLTLAKYSGEYLHCIANRDLNYNKKQNFDKMTGHVSEIYDPSNGGGLVNSYPNSYIDPNPTINEGDLEPSIRGRKLFIPLYSWFSDSSKMALPLIGLQYQEVFIKVTFRPLKELYTIIDVEKFINSSGEKKRISPDPNNTLHQLRRFLVPTNKDNGNPAVITPDTWFSDIHLMSTYIFLDKAERDKFARAPISFLVKDIVEYEFLSETGSKKIDVNSAHCVTNYMFRFRRSDVNERNEWTNFTNWDFENVRPQELKESGRNNGSNLDFLNANITQKIGIYAKNVKNILIDMGIIINGDYRENIMDNGVFLYCEKYSRTQGSFKEGLYHYSFAINTDKNTYQPSGSMNMSKFENVSFEYNTINPPKNQDNNVQIICAGNGELLGIRQDSNEVFEYNYDFKVFEERYNVMTIANGSINMMLTN